MKRISISPPLAAVLLAIVLFLVSGFLPNGWGSDPATAGSVAAAVALNVIRLSVFLGVIAAGQTLIIISGSEGIDLSAGAVVSPPTCGPCLGGPMGVLAEGERAVATTNRNFRGRMGHAKSEVYLAGPAVAAASAVRGWICHPEEVVKKRA